MTTTDHLLAAVPEFLFHPYHPYQGEYTYKVPQKTTVSPESPAAVTKGSIGTKVRIDGCCVAPLSQPRHWKLRTGRHLTYTYPFTGQCGGTSPSRTRTYGRTGARPWARGAMCVSGGLAAHGIWGQSAGFHITRRGFVSHFPVLTGWIHQHLEKSRSVGQSLEAVLM